MMEFADDEKQAILAEIEQAFEAGAGAGDSAELLLRGPFHRDAQMVFVAARRFESMRVVGRASFHRLLGRVGLALRRQLLIAIFGL